MTKIFRKTSGYSLTDLLESRTKTDLRDIVLTMELPGFNNLKKGEIVAGLGSVLIDEFIFMLKHIDDRIYGVLKTLALNGGFAAPGMVDGKLCVRLMLLGMVFGAEIEDSDMFVMPREYIEIFNDADKVGYLEAVRKNSEMVLLAQGLMSRYGAVRTLEFFDMIRKYMGEDIDEEFLYMTLRVSEIAHDIISANPIYCSYALCDDVRSVIIGADERKHLSYRQFTKKEILDYARMDYYKPTAEIDKFRTFIKRHCMIDGYELDKATLFLLTEFNADTSMRNILIYVLNEFSGIPENALGEFGEIVKELNNTTGKWILKGHSPNEAIKWGKQDKKADRLTARPGLTLIKGKNILPCPCGSGKTYKDCCGRN